jgi:hypothetical protein
MYLNLFHREVELTVRNIIIGLIFAFLFGIPVMIIYWGYTITKFRLNNQDFLIGIIFGIIILLGHGLYNGYLATTIYWGLSMIGKFIGIESKK